MKSFHHKKFKRRLFLRGDLIGKIVEGDLTRFGDFLNQPHYDSYSASGSKTQPIPEEPTEYREISGEYLETDPEIIDVAFSHQSILSTKELLNRGICTQIVGKHQKQAAYGQPIYHRPTLW